MSIRFKTPHPYDTQDRAMNTQTQASHALPPGPSDPLWGLNHLRTMRADGQRLIDEGITSEAEVLSVTRD